MRLIKHPVLCNYYVTYRCNAKCSFCDIWEKPSPYVNLENVKENLRVLKKVGVKVIDFTGGEPLLHQQIDQFFSMAKGMNFVTTLTTNAMLYPKFAERLKGKVDMLHFSLDSADKFTHDQMRGVKCFDFVMESIEVAKYFGEKPDIIFTVFENNKYEIEEVYEDICLVNDLVLILNPAFDYNSVHAGESLSMETLAELKTWGKKKNIYVNDAFLMLREDGGNQIDDPICKAASTTVVISPKNELVLPCYHLGKKSYPIQGDLEELYQSDAVKKQISTEGKLLECQGCTINCYMQPSFAVEVNKYFWKALPSTLKYNRMKGTWKNLLYK